MGLPLEEGLSDLMAWEDLIGLGRPKVTLHIQCFLALQNTMELDLISFFCTPGPIFTRRVSCFSITCHHSHLSIQNEEALFAQ